MWWLFVIVALAKMEIFNEENIGLQIGKATANTLVFSVAWFYLLEKTGEEEIHNRLY